MVINKGILFTNIMSTLMVTSLYCYIIYGGIIYFPKSTALPIFLTVYYFRYPRSGTYIPSYPIISDIVPGNFGI